MSGDPITISVTGPPQGKGRARSFLRCGRIGHYTPQRTRTYESLIFGAAIDAMGDRPPFDEPIHLEMRAIYAIPASWSERKRQRAMVGEVKPATKPDLDNVLKAWNDLVYRDDALIVWMCIEKRYGPQALVVATVKPIGAVSS